MRKTIACLLVGLAVSPLQSSAQSPVPPLDPGSFRAFAAPANAVRVSDFSGLPVPRYASLKFDEVNGRSGPSFDYPVAWSYQRSGLPVIIVRESQEWRKIRDPQGDEVWVHKRMLETARTVIAVDRGALRRKADPRSTALAAFEAGTVARLRSCAADWCEIETSGVTGWTEADLLWGARDLPAP
jgi:SH3-like domain-containing protein